MSSYWNPGSAPLPNPKPPYSSLSYPILAFYSLFQHIPALSCLLWGIQTYPNLFQPLSIYPSLYQPIQAYSNLSLSLLQPTQHFSSPYPPIQVYSCSLLKPEPANSTMPLEFSTVAFREGWFPRQTFLSQMGWNILIFFLNILRSHLSCRGNFGKDCVEV